MISMKSRFLGVLFVCLGCISGISAQDKDTSYVRYYLGVTPSSIINIVPAIQLSHRLEIGDRISLGLETGFLFTNGETISKNFYGYRLRPSIHYRVNKVGQSKIDFYLFYNTRYHIEKRVEDVWKANGAYVEKINGRKTTRFNGLGIGVNLYPSKTTVWGFGVGSGIYSSTYTDGLSYDFWDDVLYDITDNGFSRNLPVFILHLSSRIF